jgi:IclR family acetate operon transcriptional repressor
MIVDTLEGNNQLRVAFEIGERPHYHSAAIGKVLLAGMADEQVRALVGDEPFPAITPRSITSLDALRAELARVREQGYALSDQESIIGVGAVAAPLTNAYGNTVAGISVVYPSHLTSDSEIAELIALTKDYAVRASQLIGVLALPPHLGQVMLARRDAPAMTTQLGRRAMPRSELGS